MNYKPQSAETNENFARNIKKWVGVEDATLLMMEDYEGRFSNPMVKLMLAGIRQDSMRHKAILQTIINAENEPEVLTPDELGALAEFIEKHAGIEAGLMDMVSQVQDQVRNPINRLLLTYLMEDEKKHELIMDGLSEIRAKYMRAT
ncbi:MAG: hypothetical protein RRB13_03945 [bacterium]|nr:hypothetical protein [bacterium]